MCIMISNSKKLYKKVKNNLICFLKAAMKCLNDWKAKYKMIQ